jgi:hypothetical protein
VDAEASNQALSADKPDTGQKSTFICNVTRRLQHLQHVAEAAGRVDPLMRTPRQLKSIWTYIAGAAPLQDLSESQQTGVARAFVMIKTTRNQIVVKEGSLGGYFFVVLAGNYSVWQLSKADEPPLEECAAASAACPCTTGAAGGHPLIEVVPLVDTRS